MKITSNSGAITGTYFYKSKGIDIELKGDLNPNGEIVMGEFDPQGNQTGVFKGFMPNAQKITGNWGKPNGENTMDFILFETNTNYTQELEAIANKKSQPEFIRTGKHNLTLQWISWDQPGTVEIKKNDIGTYNISGQQKSTENKDYITIKGLLNPVSEKELIFIGKISYSISHINNGEECIKNGQQLFKASGNRKYWRMQDMNHCYGGGTTDYIDIYF